jgi:hypothetical protein
MTAKLSILMLISSVLGGCSCSRSSAPSDTIKSVPDAKNSSIDELDDFEPIVAAALAVAEHSSVVYTMASASKRGKVVIVYRKAGALFYLANVRGGDSVRFSGQPAVVLSIRHDEQSPIVGAGKGIIAGPDDLIIEVQRVDPRHAIVQVHRVDTPTFRIAVERMDDHWTAHQT